MNLKEVERLVSKIQHILFKNSNSYSAGLLKSSIRGSGLQFKEHQVYSHGDDVRFIDWKISARSRQTYIKTFEEERNVEIISVIDLSSSLLIGSNGKTKLQCIFEIIFLIYLLTKQTQDKQRVIIVGGKNYDLAAKSGEEGIVQLIAILEKIKILDKSGNIDLDANIEDKEIGIQVISKIKSLIARKKQVIFLSDLSNISDTRTFNKLLDYKNFHCFKIESPIERNLKKAISFKINRKKLSIFNIGQMKTDELNEFFLNKKIKKISTDERHLEKFLEEMR